MGNQRLYEFTCPYCGNYERVNLDIDNTEDIICKKCNQKIDSDVLSVVESGNMEFHGDTPTPYIPDGSSVLKR